MEPWRRSGDSIAVSLFTKHQQLRRGPWRRSANNIKKTLRKSSSRVTSKKSCSKGFKRFRAQRNMWVSKRKTYMTRIYNPINAYDGLKRGERYTFHDFVHWWPVRDRIYNRIYKL